MITFIASIFIFSLVILFHEYGHYKAAKSVGIYIEEFAIGMGPVIYKKEKNGTNFSVRIFPIGGYVKMEGEDEDINTSTSFSSKTVKQRAKTIAAGPFMNFILAIALFLITAVLFGVDGNEIRYIDELSTEYKAGLRVGDEILRINNKRVYIWEDTYYELMEQDEQYVMTVKRNGEIKTLNVEPNFRNLIGINPYIEGNEYTNIIGNVDTTMPAYKAGIREGDQIIKINNNDITSWDELRDSINFSESEELTINVRRNNEILEFVVTPQKQVVTGFNTKVEKSIVSAIVSSIYKTVYYIKLMFEFIFKLITGQLGSEGLAGPVGVISMVGETAKLGWKPLLNFAAFISINLGFMNLLPIPALDGSRLLFLLYEGVRKKRIPAEKEGFAHFVGFLFLITIMIMITYKDIVKLIG